MRVLCLVLFACAGTDRAAGKGVDTGDTASSGDTSAETDTDADTDADSDTDTDTDTDSDTDTDTDTDPGEPGPTVALSLADAKLLGEDEGDAAGYSVAPAGDLDGDGHADLLVAAGPMRAAAYVVHGPLAGERSLADAVRIELPEISPLYSSPMASADIDGDGVPDVLIGTPDYVPDTSVGGGVEVFFGPISPGAADLAPDASLDGAVSWWGYSPLAYAGAAVALADTDGDARAEIVVGDPRRAGGAVYVAAPPFTSDELETAATASIIDVDDLGGELGNALANAGDTDGDGLDDVIVTHYHYYETSVTLLLRGPASAWTDASSADAIVVGSDAYRAWGPVSSAGDIDGDGLPDLLLGGMTTGDASGGAYVVSGRVSGTVGIADAALATLLGEEAEDRAGYAVASAGDTDGDGHADLLLGGTFPYSYAATPGSVWLVRGPVSGTFDLAYADVELTGGRNEQAGYAVSSGGDMDGDGLSDLFIGGPGDDTADADAGAAWLVLGASLP